MTPRTPSPRTRRLIAFGLLAALLGATAAPVLADPPPRAPAHGSWTVERR